MYNTAYCVLKFSMDGVNFCLPLNGLLVHPALGSSKYIWFLIKKEGKFHPCTGTEALYRPYGL